MPLIRPFLLAGLSWITASLAVADQRSSFQKTVLSDDFFSEGACFADINADGHQDIVSGPYWYAGPDYRERHAYASVQRFPIAVYSRHFFSFCHDFDGDGDEDILAIPMPGTPAHWFENPQSTGALWKQHLAFHWVGNESPTLTDLTGDGKPELVFCFDGTIGYAEPQWDEPTQPWQFTPITEKRGYGRFTHGLGVGDVNSDGRLDVLETHGWWEQPEAKGELFTLHPHRFAENGGAQMFTDDVDGDGDQDVLSVQNAHGYGLCWFENTASPAKPEFQRHDILTQNPSDNRFGLSISQMHAAALTDIDGDGRQDLVTGKRFWAHGGGDPGSQELPLLYWFQNQKTEDGVEFRPWLIDERSGVGTQLTVGDLSGDGAPDIVVGNKMGTFVFTQKRADPADAGDTHPKPSEEPAHTVGTEIFAEHVRSTPPLTPEQEVDSFVLPDGFKIELVAAEPDIAKPMNLAFDALGRLWVSSSLEYPYAAPDDRPARDTIKILEDTNGDGRADKITTFAEGLNIPMGLYPYGDGVICFSIPNIWHLRDTDGDDRADTREILYGPFDCSRDTHGMCNAFNRGFDGWLYACHGFNNQSTVAGKDCHQITMQSGNTFRFRLDGSRIEQVGNGQVNPFGMTFDRLGDLFTADCHTKPINLILPGGYHDSFGKPHDGLGYVPNIMEHLHRSTGIAGIALGEATHFPDAYQTSTFGGNVVTSRINRNRLLRRGSSLIAQEEPDFLVTSDPWFRPVDLKVGPDGALYVADFYNAIIGHYEVPLTHPKRDRFRGRIWKISWQPTGQEENSPFPDLRKQSVAQLVEHLASANRVGAQLIVDELSQRPRDEVSAEARLRMSTVAPETKIHLLWTLQRQGALDIEDCVLAARASQPSPLRVHAYHLLGAQTAPNPQIASTIASGLGDPDPLVRRSAAMAAAKHRAPSLLSSLLLASQKMPASDPHGRHAIKIALKAQLAENQNLLEFAKANKLTSSEVTLLADASVAAQHPQAADFLLQNLDGLQEASDAKLTAYLRHAARAATPASMPKLVAAARRHFNGRPIEQLGLLDAIRAGLEQAGIDVKEPSTTTKPLRDWASDLAKPWLGTVDDFVPTLGWSPSEPDNRNPWTTSRTRSSSDGQKASLLWSSFPRGEQRTGRFRSEPFECPANLSFFLAGHDGYPDKRPQGKNAVYLRDATTNAELQHAQPPRNDTAQKVSWDLKDHVGRPVVLELVDGDNASAYAWMAVGRFSMPALNPSNRVQERMRGAALVNQFRLEAYGDLVRELILLEHPTSPAAAPLASALLALDRSPSPHLQALAHALQGTGASVELRQRTLRQLATRNASLSGSEAILSVWMQSVQRNEQIRLAEQLAQFPQTATTLLALIHDGKASAQLLVQPTVAETLNRSLSEAEKRDVAKLALSIPKGNDHLIKLVHERSESYRKHPGSADAGRLIFEEQCVRCHQIGGAGTILGPNLDGIGSRGLERLTEDILDPHRNVDVAFRMTAITTKDGQTHLGLIKNTTGAQLTYADPTGTESTLPLNAIAEQQTLSLSLMPATFADAIPEASFRDLQAYLLTLRH